MGECVRVDARAWACACAHVALSSMQRASAILSAASLASPYFSTLSKKRRDFLKKVCFDFLYNISHSKKNLARYCQMWKLLRLKYPLYASDFSET